MNRKYFFNTNEREKIELFLSKNGEFVGSFREKDNGRLTYLYNFSPTTILLNDNEIEFFGKLGIRVSYSKSQLEKGAELILKE